MAEPVLTYLSLGTNMGDKKNALQRAVFALQGTVGDVVRISPVYESAAWGFESDDFLNACVAVNTTLTPQELLENVLRIETEMGRKRFQEEGYEPRLIDIDILYYARETVVTEKLVIPHPELPFRKFVLRPLADIAPQFYHPILNKDTRNLIQECRDKGKLEKTTLRLFKSRQELLTHIGFIAIEGNIGAGKTTLAGKIAEDFNAKLVLERFADNPFLPKFYEDRSRYAFPLEMSFLADRYQQFSDDTSQYDLFKNFMVSDYDTYKSLIFAQVTLQAEEFRLYRKLFNLMYKEVKKPKIYVYLYQTNERLLENIAKRGREYEQNISAEYLSKIQQGYFDFFRSYPEQNSLVIDSTDLDFVADEADYQKVLQQIQEFATTQLF